MSETHIINDNTESESITLEQEASAIQDNETQTEGRPEWLPDKFKSPEDLANAYNSLEGKLGTTNNSEESSQEDLPPTESSGSQDENAQNSAIISASEEFTTNGQLSADTYDALAQNGMPRQLVDSYIAGQEALISAGETELLSQVGGREAYDRMSEWAAEGLTDVQLNAYNQALETGTDEQASLAIDWLSTKYQQANGSQASLIQGTTKGSGVSAFQSRAQVLSAMAERDSSGRKRYEQDPAYRSEVEQRLSISNV